MRLAFLILFLHLIPIVSQGQNNYFATDSSISTGGKLLDDGERINAKFCQLQKGEKIIKYSPYEINEYGFEDGRVYFARDIQIGGSSQRVFLERLVSGNTSLYYYVEEGLKTFFLEIDSTEFFELPKQDFDNEENNYTSILLDLTSDFPNFEEASNLVDYRRIALSKFIIAHNEGEIKYFPYFKYGLVLGFGLSELIPSSEIQSSYSNLMEFKIDKGFSFGFFVENPIQYSNFLLRSELYFSKHGFSNNLQLNNDEIDVVANISTINWPILFRFAYPSYKLRPFISAGSYFTYNFINESSIYYASSYESVISIDKLNESSFISNAHFGASFGGGIDYQLRYKNTLSFEFRYNLLYGSEDLEALSFSELHLITGISF